MILSSARGEIHIMHQKFDEIREQTFEHPFLYQEFRIHCG